MSGNLGDSSLPDLFFSQDAEKESAQRSPRQWAERVFGDPLALAHRIPAELFSADYLTAEDEAALYLDWQTRDTEIGYRLLEEQREELLRAIEVFRAALVKKRKAITLTRTRMDALQKISAADPSRYSEQNRAQLDSEIRTRQAELQALRYYIAPLEALDTLLRPIIGGASNEDHNLAEQRIRLLGQSWRGLMRVYAFRRSFPTRPVGLLADGLTPLFPGLVVSHCEEAPSPFNTDLLFELDTAAYLHHCLEVIVLLSEEMKVYFQSQGRPQFTPSAWPTVMQLLRAIVELFYFCDFEIPLLSNNLIIDFDDPSRIWIYRTEEQQWQTAPEETPGNRLKRDAALAAYLLISAPPLTRWQSIDAVNASATGPDVQARLNLQPYRVTGLARLDLDPLTRTHKFQTACQLTGKVIKRVSDADTKLAARLHSPLGGPWETLAGMALLDHRAYSFPDAVPLPDLERFRWLSHFWKTMGKRRPLMLLGEQYAKQVTAGFAALGEPSPENSSVLSIQLSALFARATSGEGEKVSLPDPLTALMLADQIRLMELLNSTWNFVGGVIARLGSITEDVEAVLPVELATIAAGADRQEDEISKRFNPKWLTASQPIWALLRGCAPKAWDFWAKLADRQPWTSALIARPLEESVTGLLRLCADLIRMMVLLECSSPIAAERLSIDPEQNGRKVLDSFQRCQRGGGTLSAVVAETISYYYDPDVQHDAWLAFTTSIKSHLQLLYDDLKQIDSAGTQSALLGDTIKQFELHYPTPVLKRRAAYKSDAISLQADDALALPIKPAIIDEGDASAIEALCNELLGREALDRLSFLRLLALLQVADLRAAIHFFAALRQLLRDSFPDAKQRRTFFSAQSAMRDTAQFLTNLKSHGEALNFAEQEQTQLKEYLAKLDAFQRYVEGALAGTAFYQLEDITELRSFSSGRHINLVLFLVFNKPFCGLVRTRAKETLASFEQFLLDRVGSQLTEWKPEYLILGAVGLHSSNEGLLITGTELEIDPIFVEPNKAASDRLLVTFLRSKYQLVTAILKHELPELKIMVQPS
ncbi:MAG: hypothetical protein AB1489_11880 [Acidobacteriota bacterium]